MSQHASAYPVSPSAGTDHGRSDSPHDAATVVTDSAAAAPGRHAPTVASALASALAQRASHAFALMGNGNAHLMDGLREAGLPITTVRHEAGTVASADAYHRVGGGLGIASTTYGAGFTNTLTALAESAQARIPMLVVVGDAPTGGPRPWDVDQELLAAAIGVRTLTVGRAGIDALVERAADSAMRTRRPVVLAIPYDLPTAPAETASAQSSPAGTERAAEPPSAAAAAPEPAAHAAPVESAGDLDPETFDRAVAALARAERPLILAGRGAWISGAAAELGALADTLGALTSSTALGRGIFPEQRFDLGITGGFGQEAAMELVASADAVLAVGASLNQFTMRFGDLLGAGTELIRIDVDRVAPPKSAHAIEQLLLQGDARSVLGRLRAAVVEARPEPSGWRERTAGLETGGALRTLDTGLSEHADGICADGRLDPRAVGARLAELLPEDRHVTTDGGHFIGWTNMFWPVASPERMIMVGTAYQTIGLGFSTVAGVAAAAPGSTVVLSTGDGGGLMALADLETAIRTAPRCVIVVWNDAAYGAEVHLYGRMGLDETPMRIPDANFAGLASALGATGVRVDRLADLDALADWTAAGGTGTILLDCRISSSVVAPYQVEIQRVNGVA